MGSTKKTTTEDSSKQSATTTVPAWMTQAGQQNYGDASAYIKSPAFNWSADKAAAYANPYQTQVQDRTIARMGRQNQVEQQALSDQAGAAHAYGGTRQAVMQAAQSRDQNSNILDYLASSNAAGYTQARGEFNQDRAAQLGGYSGLSNILGNTPHDTSTTGTSSGTSTATQKGSWVDTVLGAGQIAGAIWSDPRLKVNISFVRRAANGLGIYRFRYIWDRLTDPLRTGVMAPEVAEIMPEALGPMIGGYMSVRYDKMGNMA
jgi:hypothetical protein